ncbi:uncharacterized protein LOC115443601 isoform X2 [Manduca sexta]|uniref:uncharacterized protein LOC115443601 isoform X2 n=1 Tax=Manduca sexta TaxID=7130 RepID=UPI001183C7F3|nr:uncharacterized protein LOC115443601 isoform X2 [Manduca sexta]
MSEPKVWSRFSVKAKDGKVLKLRIEAMTEDRREELMNLLINYFIPEESLHKSLGIPQKPDALAELIETYKEFWSEKPNQNLTICVSDDETETRGELLGASLIALEAREDASKEKPHYEPNTEEMKKFIEIYYVMAAKYNAFDKYDFDKFYNGRGLVVHPKCRGLGIAQEFLRVRRLVCKENNIPMTGAWMTAYGTQKAAARDNWETVFEMNTEDYAKEVGIKFENVPPTFMYMIGRSE